MEKIRVIDYGVGNIRSVVSAFRRIGAEAELTTEPDVVRRCRKLVLPGVGHFGESMENLRRSGLDAALGEAIDSGAHVLGICVGFQMLFEASEEAPGVPGLGLLPGRVHRFPPGKPVPHIGWNQLKKPKDTELLRGIEHGDYFYFLHSYYVSPGNGDVEQAQAEYGLCFCAVGGRERVFGIQFHPEKSQTLGLRVLQNFHRASS
jgi:glutamine amidotransferase